MLLQAKIALNKPYLFAISFISVVVYLAKTALNSAYFYMKFIIRPQIRRDYPLNLSILLSGGKETNQDSFSNGEWTRNSPSPNPSWHQVRNCGVKDSFRHCFDSSSSLEWGFPIAGVRPLRLLITLAFSVPRVGLLEIAALRRVVNSIQG